MPAPYQHAPGQDGQPADLSAIRRTDAIIDLIASRRLLRSHALGDPAITLLHSLAADVDSAIGAGIAAAVRSAARARAATASREAPLRERGYRPGHPGPRPGRHRRPGVTRPHTVAAAMIVTVAAAVAAAGLMAVSMLLRLGGRAAGRPRR